MKKIIIVLSLLTIVNVTAQSNVKFGLKAGLNNSKISFDGVQVEPNVKYKIGYHVGGLLWIELNKKLALQPEVIFSNQGYKFNLDDTENNQYYKFDGTINYLHIPLVLKYYVAEKFNLEAGAQFGFLLKYTDDVQTTTVDLADPNNNVVINEHFDNKEFQQKYEGGFIVGAQYTFTKNLFSSLRYTWSISQTNKEVTGLGYKDTTKEKNNVFQLSVGYLFN